MMKTYNVLVLLSAYNGEKYIKEQIDSIENQKGINVTIYIRDDGSTDQTIKIIESIANAYKNIKYIKGHNKGFIGSFSELINYAYSSSVSYDYYAFSDQDDIWYLDKLLVSCRALDTLDKNRPNLFCCNSDLIDNNRNKIGIFKTNKPHITRGNALYYGSFQGCSMLFNVKALELYQENPPKTVYHDKWMYLICFYLGNVKIDLTPKFAYRIHGHNAIGVKTAKNSLVTDFKKLVNHNDSHNQDDIQIFYKTFYNQISNDDKKLFKIYLNYKHNCLSKLKIIGSKSFGGKYCSFRECVNHVLRVAFNRI